MVVELNSESRARRPTTRSWAIMRRAERAHRLATERVNRRIERTGRPGAWEEREFAAEVL
jgi:hypothetical protein